MDILYDPEGGYALVGGSLYCLILFDNNFVYKQNIKKGSET